LGFGIWKLEFGIWKLEIGIWNLEFGIGKDFRSGRVVYPRWSPAMMLNTKGDCHNHSQLHAAEPAGVNHPSQPEIFPNSKFQIPNSKLFQIPNPKFQIPSRRIVMDWRVLLTTFGIIFLAEMGDKTQLAAMTMSADSKRPWMVFIGASLALICVSAIGVAVGGVVGNYVPIEWVKRIAAVAFILIGVLMLWGKF
jgi:putative Ca2+/H+ antiporter (TMEM165/GDT1 family)